MIPQVCCQPSAGPFRGYKTATGTPAASLESLPYDYGRFRIIAPQSYNYCDASPPGSTRIKQVTKRYVPSLKERPPDAFGTPDGDVLNVTSLESLKNHRLFVQPAYVPASWDIVGAEAFSIDWSDGSHMDPLFTLEYGQPGQFYIRVTRYFIGPDCQYEVTDEGRNPELQHSLTLSEMRGVPILVLHQTPGEKIQATLQVNYVSNNVVTMVEGVAVDLDELLKMADSLLAQD